MPELNDGLDSVFDGIKYTRTKPLPEDSFDPDDDDDYYNPSIGARLIAMDEDTFNSFVIGYLEYLKGN